MGAAPATAERPVYRLVDGCRLPPCLQCACQRLTGGPLVINVWIEKQFVAAPGAEPKSFAMAGGSGKKHEVFFCERLQRLRAQAA